MRISDLLRPGYLIQFYGAVRIGSARFLLRYSGYLPHFLEPRLSVRHYRIIAHQNSLPRSKVNPSPIISQTVLPLPGVNASLSCLYGYFFRVKNGNSSNLLYMLGEPIHVLQCLIAMGIEFRFESRENW